MAISQGHGREVTVSGGAFALSTWGRRACGPINCSPPAGTTPGSPRQAGKAAGDSRAQTFQPELTAPWRQAGRAAECYNGMPTWGPGDRQGPGQTDWGRGSCQVSGTVSSAGAGEEQDKVPVSSAGSSLAACPGKLWELGEVWGAGES